MVTGVFYRGADKVYFACGGHDWRGLLDGVTFLIELELFENQSWDRSSDILRHRFLFIGNISNL